MEHYLKIIPNPVQLYSDPNRKSLLSSQENDESLDSNRDYAFIVLCNLYRFHRKKDIQRLLHTYDYDLIKTTNRLDRLPKAFKTQREIVCHKSVTKNIALLQEVNKTKYSYEVSYVFFFLFLFS